MAFFSSPIKPEISDPMADLPTSYKDVEDSNATVKVTGVRPIQSKTSPFTGIVWECEITLDGSGEKIIGDERSGGVKGVDLMVTIQPKEGALSATDQGKSNRKIESRFGEAYKAAGHALAKNEDGFLMPDGLDQNDEDLGEAILSIKGAEFRAKVWKWKGTKSSGVEFFAAD